MTDDLESAKRIAESWHLGQTSASYESGSAGAGAISSGKDDRGGVSYGSYQLSSKTGTLREYLEQSSYGAQFDGLTPVTPEFDAKWRQLAKDDEGFALDQHDFVGRSHYIEQARALSDRGIHLSERGMAVQDALWSTSVQFRGLTPSIFSNGLKEKFGDHYDLARLSDKDIVGAVQDYKIDHVDHLFSKSPKLHDSLKDRFADEKIALEHLADADRVLKENGITVEHKSSQGAPSGQDQDKAVHVQHPGTLRVHDHSTEVRDLQSQLAELGYKDANGKPLQPDGNFGANTKFAVETFQRDYDLVSDGIAGLKTLAILSTIRTPAHTSLTDTWHAGHTMYQQALVGVHTIDARLGRTPDHVSSNLAGSLATTAYAQGLERIDHVILSDDAQRAYAVQGELNSPFKRIAEVNVIQAVAQPLELSSAAWQQTPQQTQELTMPHQNQQQPGMHR